jgi:hypothetical protein
LAKWISAVWLNFAICQNRSQRAKFITHCIQYASTLAVFYGITLAQREVKLKSSSGETPKWTIANSLDLIIGERLIRMNRARRLSVRVPASGWEVYISTEQSGCARARIANISADGAFVITNNPYRPGSKVTLLVQSALVCFSVTGLVLRNDSYGIAIRFLDLSEPTRNSILNIISRFLVGRWSKDSMTEETSFCA